MMHYLRQWREAKGLNLRQMASRIGVHKSILSRIENGKRPYQQHHLEAIAGVIGCTPADLIGRLPDKF